MGTVNSHRRLLLGADPPTPSQPSFDVNMVVILAALLCALICALGLNFIVRCALRCSSRLDSPDGAAAPPRAAVVRRGLKKSALQQIPVVVYGDGGLRVMATDCTICLGEFADGEKVRVLPKCNHGFHVRCIDTWLVANSSCPTCRRSLAEGGGATAVASVAVVAGVGVGVGRAAEQSEAAVGIGEYEES